MIIASKEMVVGLFGVWGGRTLAKLAVANLRDSYIIYCSQMKRKTMFV
jgi:hypothetical protein